MIGEFSAWIVGLSLVTISVLKVFWGLDLILTEILPAKDRWRVVKRSGSFWLGQYFVLSAIMPTGFLGLLLIHEPTEGVSAAFAIPIIIGGFEAGMAWFLLAREDRNDDVGAG